MTEPVAFGCEDGFQALLGSFDGRDRRTLSTHAFSQRPEHLLVSMHEQMHEELHWSTVWGVTAAMAGLLARAGVRTESLDPAAEAMNVACRQVHERFATTLSSGVLGVGAAQVLMAGNPLYLGYLNDGLAVGGLAARWPWQFREAAIQMLFRMLMQPAELGAVAEAGFGRLRPGDVAVASTHPDVRWAAVRDRAGGWWEATFAEILDAHPLRGGDTGGRWERHLPDEPEAMEELKAWEETVLIPALGETARRELASAGYAVLAQDEYLEVAAALRTSFLDLAPEDWEVEVFQERRRLSEELLGGEREGLKLADEPAALEVCDADDLPARAGEFLIGGPDERHVLSMLLDRAVLRRQFTGLEEIPVAGPPILAMTGPGAGSPRRVPIALMRPGLAARDLVGMFSSLPVITFSTLRTALHDTARDALLDLDEAYVLVDLPLRTQIPAWIEQRGRVRLRVTDVDGPNPMNLIVLQPEGLSSLWMLCFRSDGGIGELAQLLDRHSGQLTSDLDIPAPVARRIGMVTAWLHGAWWLIEETPDQ